MSPLNTITAAAALALSATCSLARPEINQLPALNSAIRSQERTVGTDCRAADDFTLPAGNGRPHHVRLIQVVMSGNGAPLLERFGVTLFRRASVLTSGFGNTNQPGLPLATRLGASSIVRLTTGTPFSTYLVTFQVPAGEIVVAPGTRLWISGFGRLADTNSWGFCRTSRLPTNGTNGWFSEPFTPNPITGASWTSTAPSLAFRVVTAQP